MTGLRIVLANATLASYPRGGGHWSVRLQYLLGLRALGHDVMWLELFRATGDPEADRRQIDAFFRRFRRYGLRDRCALLYYRAAATLEGSTVYGMSAAAFRRRAAVADLLWNFCCAARQPLLSLFAHPVLVDLDPGHLQVSALAWDLDIASHRAFLTVGTKMHEADCEVPTLGLRWHRFLPFVYLPWWPAAPAPRRGAPITSVTHWTWEELWWGERTLSVSKRTAYLRYLDLPLRTGRPFELAVHLHPDDHTGDRDLLQEHAWHPIHPYRVAGSPATYRRYIRDSRAEFCCPKPIHRELRTGWFSDRSAAYLASGRPVLMEDTGVADHLPGGEGLLFFRDVDEAAAAVEAIDADYARHAHASRELAETYLDSRRSLERMLSACYRSRAPAAHLAHHGRRAP
jgi:hypothetical protein